MIFIIGVMIIIHNDDFVKHGLMTYIIDCPTLSFKRSSSDYDNDHLFISKNTAYV
jgi:hypothetical protein